MGREGEGTKFTIDRKIFSSDIWFDSPWKLKIWIYLIGNANHKDGKFMNIPIKRGQLIRSYRTIRKDCGYRIGYRMKYPSLDTVRRICEDLTKELRIVQRTVQCGTLFTICNYNDLQSMPKKRTEQRKQGLSYNDRTVTVQNKNVQEWKEINNKYKKIYYCNFLLKNGEYYMPPEDFILTLHENNPLVDFKIEFQKIHTWCLANEGKRKTQRGAKKFLNSWISGANEKLRQSGVRGNSSNCLTQEQLTELNS